jgi:FtsH-binding integral membrane protein
MGWVPIILAILHGYTGNTRLAFYVIQAVGIAIGVGTTLMIRDANGRAGIPLANLTVHLAAIVAFSLLAVYAGHYLGRWLARTFRKVSPKSSPTIPPTS